MGGSSDSRTVREIKMLPDDQYCTDRKTIPEIISIDYNNGVIEFKCKNHQNKKMNIKEYFEKESKYLYYNTKCDGSKAGKQKDNLSYIFNYFIDIKQNLCENCSSGKKSKSIKINELNNICQDHLRKYINYCKDCDKHFCSQDKILCQHSIKEIKRPTNEEIDKIKNKINILMKYQKISKYLIKFLNTLLTTYIKHPSNYYNSINITNIVKDMNYKVDNKVELCLLSNQRRTNLNINEDDSEKLLNKIKNLEKSILSKLNVEYKINLTGEELKINLNGKNVDNIGFELLCSIPYKNVEEIDLGNNNISKIDAIKNLDSPNLKILILRNNKIKDIEPLKNISSLKDLDLSCNEIENINALKEILKNNKNLEKINLENNIIKNIGILKDKNLIIPITLKSINLEKNNIIEKEYEEVYDIINKNNPEFMNIIYKKGLNNSYIKLFGENFVKNNKDKAKIIIDGIEKELITHYICNNKEKIKVKLKINENENITDMSEMFSGCSTLSYIERISKLKTGNVTNMSGMFRGCSALSSLEGISKWQTENVTNMSYMFSECSLLSSLEGISNWQTENVSDMSYMFNKCSKLLSLKAISKWKTGKVTDMSYIFNECKLLSSLEGVSKWQTKNVINMRYMFNECSTLSSLEGVSKWQTEKVTDMSYMFYLCSDLSSLKGISKWQTNSVINMTYMFGECTSLSSLEGVSKWKTGNVTDMSNMFSGCKSITSLDGISEWETGNVINMSGMFSRCSSLSSLDSISKWQTGNVTAMNIMFYGCSSLSSLVGISKWQTKNVTTMEIMFYGCSSLSSLDAISNWQIGKYTNQNGMFSECPKLLNIQDIFN